MSALGTLHIIASGGLPKADLALDLLLFPDGFPQVDATWITEPVTSLGVNYTRLRKVRLDFQPFAMNWMVGVSNWATAVANARGIRQFSGRLATLDFTSGGTSYSITDPMYVGFPVRAVPRPGEFVAPDQVVSPAMAYITGTFNLQVTKLS